ncbi:MAG TPA: carboxypeptidase-like regulatory domain-containing protein, partial [Vicinamibacteria bacterium]|nr:carboxypeptidase-like regulatory domain-containing protein [Vicinamibacteria bacterium]
MRKQRLFLLAVSLVGLAVPVSAQRSTGAIRGTVTDPSHLVVVGAKVTVKGEETGFTRTTTTNSAGAYSFPDLPVGSYRIDVDSPGFKTAAL